MEKRKKANRSSNVRLLQIGMSLILIFTVLNLKASDPGKRDTVSVRTNVNNAIIDKGKAKIIWQPQSFPQKGYYILEKSQDNRTFILLHKIHASNIDSLYSFEDIRPLKGISYYRLRYCETETESTIVHTFKMNYSSGSIPDFRVYLDNKMNKLKIEFTDIKKPLEGSIYIKDVNGNIVYNKKIDISIAHSLNVVLNQEIPVGTYDVLVANTEGHKKNQWIVIKD